MALKKDKQKVLGEMLDDQRIKRFLDYEAPKGVDADFHVLEKAYRGMRAENFMTFLHFFTAAKRNLHATNPEGKSLLDIVSTHRHADDYVAALKEHLAK
jgi:hypothetical protein